MRALPPPPPPPRSPVYCARPPPPLPPGRGPPLRTAPHVPGTLPPWGRSPGGEPDTLPRASARRSALHFACYVGRFHGPSGCFLGCGSEVPPTAVSHSHPVMATSPRLPAPPRAGRVVVASRTCRLASPPPPPPPAAPPPSGRPGGRDCAARAGRYGGRVRPPTGVGSPPRPAAAHAGGFPPDLCRSSPGAMGRGPNRTPPPPRLGGNEWSGGLSATARHAGRPPPPPPPPVYAPNLPRRRVVYHTNSSTRRGASPANPARGVNTPRPPSAGSAAPRARVGEADTPPPAAPEPPPPPPAVGRPQPGVHHQAWWR